MRTREHVEDQRGVQSPLSHTDNTSAGAEEKISSLPSGSLPSITINQTITHTHAHRQKSAPNHFLSSASKCEREREREKTGEGEREGENGRERERERERETNPRGREMKGDRKEKDYEGYE